jgi:hypothetical protein
MRFILAPSLKWKKKDILSDRSLDVILATRYKVLHIQSLTDPVKNYITAQYFVSGLPKCAELIHFQVHNYREHIQIIW